ncbi:MAG: four helix bundle protein [Candidatus Cloacimonadia bacterium]
MRLEELEVYQLTMKLGENIWKVVAKWDYFAKETIGKQLVRLADSISANLAKGYGRFFYKENRQFCYYSRDSFYETNTRLTKSHNMGLVSVLICNPYKRY